MKRTGFAITILILVVLASAGIGVWQRHSSRDVQAGVEFTATGAKVVLSRRTGITRVTITDDAGRPMMDTRYGGVERGALSLVFPWESGTGYSFHIVGKRLDVTVRAKSPYRTLFASSVGLLAPYDGEMDSGGEGTGQFNKKYSASVASGSEFTAALSVINQTDSPMSFRAVIDLPESAELLSEESISPQDRVTRAGRRVIVDGKLDVQFDKSMTVMKLRIDRKGQSRIQCSVTTSATGSLMEYERIVDVDVIAVEKLSKAVAVTGQMMPTGAEGFFDAKNRRDSLFIRPEILKKIGTFFGVAEEHYDRWSPTTYQTLVLNNRTDRRMALMLKSDIYEKDRDSTARAFFPPSEYLGGRNDVSVIVATTLEPLETSKVVLPLFVTDKPDRHVYRRKVSLIPMGTTTTIGTYEFPLYITTSNAVAFMFTVSAIILAFSGIAVFVCKFRSIVAGMKIRWFIIISLFGALTFAIQSVPTQLFGSMLNAVMGPFSVFITGFFSEIVHVALLVALMRLIPRPGVVTLKMLVSYLLGAVFLGSIHVTDILYTGTSVTMLEMALFVSGVTRRREAFRWTPGATFLVATCLAAAHSFCSLTNINIYMALYRLYYAQWYVAMNIVVNGVIYVYIATFIGKRFSDTLAWSDV